MNIYTLGNLKIANLAQGIPTSSPRYLLDLADWFRALSRRAKGDRGRRCYMARCEALMARVRQVSYQMQDGDQNEGKRE